MNHLPDISIVLMKAILLTIQSPIDSTNIKLAFYVFMLIQTEVHTNIFCSMAHGSMEPYTMELNFFLKKIVVDLQLRFQNT